MHSTARPWRSLPWWRAALLRLLLGALAWWVLTEGATDSWYVGVPAVLLAVAASLRWSGSTLYSIRLAGVAPLAAHFLRSSLVAGFDVARRALAPSLPIDPALLRVDTWLPAGAPRWLLSTSLTLVPGSLVVAGEGNQLLLHTLDRRRDLVHEVRTLERLIAGLFALPEAPA